MIDTANAAFVLCTGRRKAEYNKRRNALTSRILNLPTELQLAIISSILSGSTAKPDANRRRLASVCSHWRAIVFGWPQLWNTIALNEGHAAVTRALKFSHTVPFSVTGRGDLELLSPIGPHTHRCTIVDIEGRRTTAALLEFFNNPFPRLEGLFLDLSRGRNLDAYDPQRVHVPIQGNPPLRYLQLSAVRIPLTSFNPSSLQSLLLRWVKVPVEEWEILLASCLALEDMTVDQSMMASPSVEPTVPPTILPKLRKLKFWEASENIIHHTISLIDAPNLEEFHIDAKSMRPPGTETFSRLFRPSHTLPLPAVILERSKIDQLQIAYTNRGSISHVAVRGLCGQDERLCLVIEHIRWTEALQGIHRLFPSGRIDVPVTLDLCKPDGHTPWDVDLGDVPTLTHLESKDGTDLLQIFEYLSSSTPGTTHLPCPKLQEIKIPSEPRKFMLKAMWKLLGARAPPEDPTEWEPHRPCRLVIRTAWGKEFS